MLPGVSRQAEILATAARLFNERGFHGVSVDEIGRQLGVTGPALYRHFKGKDEILATLFNDAMDRAAIDPSSFTDDPHEQLDLLIRHHARFVVEHRDLVAIYAHEHRALVDPWRTMFVRRMTEHGARWDAVITACHPDADPLDVRTTTQAAIGLLHSVVTWPPALVDRPDIVERLRDQVLRGVGRLAEPTPTPAPSR